MERSFQGEITLKVRDTGVSDGWEDTLAHDPAIDGYRHASENRRPVKLHERSPCRGGLRRENAMRQRRPDLRQRAKTEVNVLYLMT